MTTTYDPFHPNYFVESDLREELTRVYDLCHGCRLCFKFCTAFPTLFEMIDEHDDRGITQLTPRSKDQVVDECFQCKLCYINCPYIPGQSEWNLDFPRLMMRADQVRFREQKQSPRSRVTDKALASTDLTGRGGSLVAPLANLTIRTPGSAPRKLMEKVTGIAAERVLPPFQRTRFTTWFRRHTPQPATGAKRDQIAAVFPTCLVEYQDTQVGKDLVRVYERNGVECQVPEGQICCGAPMLHQGDVEGFRVNARRNIETLSRFIRTATSRGQDVTVVVPQPTCGYVLKKDYPDYVAGADAELVAAHTKDASEFLMDLHKADKAAGGDGLDTEFGGHVPATTTYHAPCHLRAQNIGLRSRDLMKLTGTKITLVAECSAIDGTWGLRAENLEISRKVAQKMANDIRKADSEAVAGDCSLANGGIVLETGAQPQHPLSLVARAYGIPID
ncbi:MAG: heterodisulfide reductase-related iron-sulfur binding cluster [Acidimicrobiales bacterium]